MAPSRPGAADRPREIGPYRITGTLGRGGMGVVYRGIHRVDGSRAAVKTVKVASEGLLQSLRREIHALASLRHPGVVPVVGEGVHGGLPWYAMPILEGPTMKGLALDRPSRRPGSSASARSSALAAVTEVQARRWPRLDAAAESAPRERPVASAARLRRLLGIVRRLCRVLAFVHGEGLVHRDLKPDNVIVTRRTRPVLTDFGLVSGFPAATSRDALEAAGLVVGTVAYMAPEQVRGDLVDARADLYALGSVLYELLTGELAYGVEGAFTWTGETPAAPSSKVTGLPPALDAIVLRLLARRAEERFGHAMDVDAALAELGVPGGDGEGEAWPAPRAYLYRPRLLGRDDLRDGLLADLAGVGVRGGTLAVVLGESGAGKSRLALEITREATRRQVPLLLAESSPGSSSPLGGLRRALVGVADRCRQLGAEETERILGSRARLLGAYEPALLELPSPGHPEPPELPADAARLRLFHALDETLRALHAGPQLLVLDDLQWADELTLGWLEHLARGALATLPLLVVGTCRSEEIPALLAGLLASADRVRDVRLGALPTAVVGSIVADALATRPLPASLVEAIAERTGGNPFFVAEYLRLAVSEGLLARDAQGRWRLAGRDATGREVAELPAPGSVRELVARRLDALGGGARDLARTCAVAGREMDVELVLGASPGDAALATLSELLARQVLEEREPGTLRFVHDQIREAAYASLPEEERRVRHRAVALALELRAPERRAAAALGGHWERASDPLRARAHYRDGARSAARRHALVQARTLLERFLALGGGEPLEELDARLELGRVLDVAGKTTEAAAELAKARDVAVATGARHLEGRALAELGSVRLRTGRMDEARETLELALGIARGLGDLRLESEVLGTIGHAAKEQDRVEEAERLYREAVALGRRAGAREREADWVRGLAGLYREHGRLAEAALATEEALALARETGDRRGEGIALGNLGNLEQLSGRSGAAEARFREALAISREVGDRRSEGIALGNLAVLAHQRSDREGARRLYVEALAVHHEVGNLAFEGHILGNVAGLSFDEGRLEEARGCFARAADIAARVGDRRLEGCFRRDGARTELLAGTSRDEVSRLLDEAEAILASAQDPLELARAACLRGHVALAGGASARDQIDRAVALVRDAGAPGDVPLEGQLGDLERSQAGWERGEPLLHGYLVGDLGPGQRAWLRARGHRV